MVLAEPLPSTTTTVSWVSKLEAPGLAADVQEVVIASIESNWELLSGVECVNSPVPDPRDARTVPEGLFVKVQFAELEKSPFANRFPSFPLSRKESLSIATWSSTVPFDVKSVFEVWTHEECSCSSASPPGPISTPDRLEAVGFAKSHIAVLFPFPSSVTKGSARAVGGCDDRPMPSSNSSAMRTARRVLSGRAIFQGSLLAFVRPISTSAANETPPHVALSDGEVLYLAVST
ncbi:MAG TPA: hypothetical protein VJ224_05320 [Thermoplasmata archaeon]|nr:hypothetical protein [Thermoplasmata archaeon]